jgi:membrane associated rhomboid family serine protease
MTSNNTPPGAAGLGIWGNLGVWLAFGAAFGPLAGGFLGNVALGLALGPALGLVVYFVFIAPRRNADGES